MHIYQYLTYLQLWTFMQRSPTRNAKEIATHVLAHLNRTHPTALPNQGMWSMHAKGVALRGK